MAGLTIKQEKFCMVYIETGNASEAYRQAYNTANMKESSINVNASKLLADAKITLRLQELKKEHAKQHNITVESLIDELEEARTVGKQAGNGSAMATATMGKAKLLGLLDKKEETNEEELPKSIEVRIVDARKNADTE